MDTTETHVPNLLTVSEAARLLHVSKPTLYRRITTGEVPAIRLGPVGPLRVERSALMEWAFGDGPEPAA